MVTTETAELFLIVSMITSVNGTFVLVEQSGFATNPNATTSLHVSPPPHAVRFAIMNALNVLIKIFTSLIFYKIRVL